MKLCDALAGVNVIENPLPLDTEIDNIDSSSRNISGTNCIFAAIRGVSTDGHLYSQDAVKNGAFAVLGEYKTDVLVPQIIVDNSRKAYSRIYANLVGNPADSIKMCGITGTNGKTSTAYMTHHILTQSGKNTGLISTVENIVNGKRTPSLYTTPETKSLQNLLLDMKNTSTEFAVSEVSSHSLSQDRVEGIEFEVGAFTNLTQDHLDYHGTMENYLHEKLKLMKKCRIAVINADDKYSEHFKNASSKYLTYGIDNKSDIMAKELTVMADGSKFKLSFPCGEYDCYIKVRGRFSVYNALCASANAYALGVAPSKIAKAINSFGGVRGRMENYPTGLGFSVVLDYAHTPDGLLNALKSLKELPYEGKLTVLFGCGGDRDKTKRPQMGAIAEEYADLAIVTSDNPRTEDPSLIIKDILAGMKKDNRIVIEDRRKAMEYAITNAEKGDLILFAGKGHEDYQILKDGKIHFDEREIIEEILEDIKRRQ